MLLGGPSMSAAVVQNSIQAVVNDSIITTFTLDESVREALDLLQRTYYNQPAVLRERVDKTYDEALQRLVERELILDEFSQTGAVFPPSLLDEEVQRRIRAGFGGDRVTFIKTLEAEGMTVEAFRDRVKEEMIIQYMLQVNVTSVNVVSPAKIEKYYKANQEKFEVDEEIKLRVIVLDHLLLAREVASKIQHGTSFAEMAEIYGSQSQKSGDWGWTEASTLKRGLADIAFSLPIGKPSGVVGLATDLTGDYWTCEYNAQGVLVRARRYSTSDELTATRQGPDLGTPPLEPLAPDDFYLLLVEEKRPARVRPLSEVRDEIERELIVQERERLRKRWIERLKDKSFVRYF